MLITQVGAALILVSFTLVSFCHAEKRLIQTWGWKMPNRDNKLVARENIVLEFSPKETITRHYTVCSTNKKIYQIDVYKTGGPSGKFTKDKNLFMSLVNGGPDQYCATIEFMVLPTDVESMPLTLELLVLPYDV